MSTNKASPDSFASGKLWANIAHRHTNLQLLRCTDSPWLWIPVSLLTGNSSHGWLTTLDIEWGPLDSTIAALPVLSIPKGRRLQSQRQLMTEFELSLTAGLLAQNTWFTSVSFDCLEQQERDGIKRFFDKITGEIDYTALFVWTHQFATLQHSQEIDENGRRLLLQTLTNLYGITITFPDLPSEQISNDGSEDGNVEGAYLCASKCYITTKFSDCIFSVIFVIQSIFITIFDAL